MCRPLSAVKMYHYYSIESIRKETIVRYHAAKVEICREVTKKKTKKKKKKMMMNVLFSMYNVFFVEKMH